MPAARPATPRYSGKDLADVIELIRVNALPAAYQERLHPYVRERFVDLWQAAQVRDSQ